MVDYVALLPQALGFVGKGLAMTARVFQTELRGKAFAWQVEDVQNGTRKKRGLDNDNVEGLFETV